MFAALALIVWGSQKHFEDMRVMILDRLRAFPNKYIVNRKSSIEFEEQCILIAKGKTSGFQLVLQAIADITLAVVEIEIQDDSCQQKQVIEPLRRSEERIEISRVIRLSICPDQSWIPIIYTLNPFFQNPFLADKVEESESWLEESEEEKSDPFKSEKESDKYI